MYNSIYEFDIIYLPEKYLDSSILHDNSNLEIPRYNLVRSNHPSNKKTWKCLYIIQESFAFKNHRYYLNECVKFQLMVCDTLCNLIAICRSPSQSQDQFESFKQNLELNLESAGQNNPFQVSPLAILTKNLVIYMRMT